MLLRKFRRHFGISSRKVAGQMPLAWYWRWAVFAAVIVVGSELGWFVRMLTRVRACDLGGGVTAARPCEHMATIVKHGRR